MIEVFLNIFLNVLGFFIGLHLTVKLFGSLYRIIDLWFCIKDFWIEITAHIALNSTLIFLIYFLTSGSFETGFLIGQIFFAVFHILIFWVGRLALFILRRP